MVLREHIQNILADLDLRPFIGGAFTDSLGHTIPITDPMTGATLCEMPMGNAADVRAAVGEAQRACDLEEWTRNARKRAALLFHLADLIEQQSESIAAIETAD